MSFIPPIHGPSPLDNELVHAKQAEIEAKVERYAQLHPYDPDRETRGGPVGRALRRVRAAITGRR
jgi:hypothetical protein